MWGNSAHAARRRSPSGGLLPAEEDGLEVDGRDEVPIPLGDLERVEAREAGGVVDQPVEASQALFHLAEHTLDLGHGFQVGAEELGAAALFGRAARFGLGMAIVYGDARAFFGEAQRDAAADALGGAGDEDGLAVKGGGVHSSP